MVDEVYGSAPVDWFVRRLVNLLTFILAIVYCSAIFWGLISGLSYARGINWLVDKRGRDGGINRSDIDSGNVNYRIARRIRPSYDRQPYLSTASFTTGASTLTLHGSILD